MEESRRRAEVALSQGSLKTWPATLVIVLIWVMVLALISWKVIAKFI